MITVRWKRLKLVDFAALLLLAAAVLPAAAFAGRSIALTRTT